MLADDQPRQNHADDVRNAQLTEQHGSKQDDKQHQQKYPRGVGYR